MQKEFSDMQVRLAESRKDLQWTRSQLATYMQRRTRSVGQPLPSHIWHFFEDLFVPVTKGGDANAVSDTHKNQLYAYLCFYRPDIKDVRGVVKAWLDG